MFRFSANLVACALLTVAMALTAGVTLGQQEKAGTPMAVSPDGTRAARGDDKSITIFDPQTQKDLCRMQGHTDKVTALAFSQDGKLLASGGLDKRVSLWDTATGRQICQMKAENVIEGIIWSGDGRSVIVREADKTTREFDASTGKVVRVTKDEKK
jgi:WD40 repeat protein